MKREVQVCTGCGSTLQACCPERNMIPVRDLWRAEYEGRARERLLREMLVTIESYCRTFARRRKLAVEVQEFVHAVLKDAYKIES